MERSAVLSQDRRYRYQLFRVWDRQLPVATFIGLNPSTADETTDDPTIRRCIGYARAWGCGSLEMLNLFALRATDPFEMLRHPDPVGLRNDFYLKQATIGTRVVVAAWGTMGGHLGRDQVVRGLIGDGLHCLRLTKAGHPWHPLYLPKGLTPVPWPAVATEAFHQAAPAVSRDTAG